MTRQEYDMLWVKRSEIIRKNRVARIKGGTLIEVPPKPQRPTGYNAYGSDGNFLGFTLGSKEDSIKEAKEHGFVIAKLELVEALHF